MVDGLSTRHSKLIEIKSQTILHHLKVELSEVPFQMFPLVERSETYQVGSTTISELYLSNIDANNAAYNANTDSGFTSFLTNDRITTTTADDDGNYSTPPLTGIPFCIN